ncbi:MAG: glycosyltransferase family 4 protein [Acidimicrobiales bacterium]|nr:glycosyltransferase family 4 protein [Acidimicrobiales bacterium]HJO79975.1 glycosyltransferase family 4 protein [Acidimicrobiales bacterium]
MPRCTIVSFRFGVTDGVSVVAQTWADALLGLGFEVTWVAGSFEPGWTGVGHARTLPGLEMGSKEPPDRAALANALGDADLVIVENLCSIPLNIPAASMVADLRRGLPTILHHHDPPWQRKRFEHVTELPPDDTAWRHVTINDLTCNEMAERGITATTIYNGFDKHLRVGDRHGTRRGLGISNDTILVAHPVRAIPRKAIELATALSEAIDGTYWLTGPAEDGFGPELASLLAAARCPVIHAQGRPAHDIYAAADLIAFPSTWEGFGNPPVEAALYRRPVVVGDYPVAVELRKMGFSWFSHDRPDEILSWLTDPDQARREEMLDTNRRLAVQNFSLEMVADGLETLLDEAGWLP